jgi:hypothetical protein
MAIASSNFPELLWPGIADLYGTAYNQWPELFPQYMDLKYSDKRFEKVQGVTGFPLASIKTEGSQIAYVDPMQGFQTEYVMESFAIGCVITMEMYDDEQYGYINQLPELLARSMRQSQETDSANILNRAFNSAFAGSDGVSLCSTSHILAGGGTFRNQLSTAADLDQTSLEIALQDIKSQFVDEQGLKMLVRPTTLVVAPDFMFRAVKLLNSGQVTGSADNDVNPLVTLGIRLVVNPWLTDTDAWFVKTDVPNGLTFYWRMQPELSRDNEFDTKNLKMTVVGRWDTGWSDPRGVFGTAGA